MHEKILIVDDEPSIRNTFSKFLKGEGFSVSTASGGKEAFSMISKGIFDLVLLDLKMPNMDGISVLKGILKTDTDLPVIMISGHGEIPVAVAAMQLGAYDFLCKPPDFDNLVLVIRRAIELRRLKKEIKQLDESFSSSLEMLLGRSSAIKKVIEDIRRVASSDFSLIIEGETGTGKTFVASIIHNLSRRSKGPFVSIDIGVIPESLVASELFGHEKGAFTGAEKSKKGHLEIANEGTLFIDELQNITPYVQSKLLKVVEEKQFYPVGSSHLVKTDMRIISATNTHIAQAVRDKTFREDLYYRLNEFTIKLPPLRKRTDDIALLAQGFLRAAASDLDKHISFIDDEVLAFFMKQPWQGNVRELKNVIKKASLLCDKEHIDMDILKQAMAGTLQESESRDGKLQEFLANNCGTISMNEAEKIAITLALADTGGNKTKAAEIVQITLKTLLKKIKEYDIAL